MFCLKCHNTLINLRSIAAHCVSYAVGAMIPIDCTVYFDVDFPLCTVFIKKLRSLLIFFQHFFGRNVLLIGPNHFQ